MHRCFVKLGRTGAVEVQPLLDDPQKSAQHTVQCRLVALHEAAQPNQRTLNIASQPLSCLFSAIASTMLDRNLTALEITSITFKVGFALPVSMRLR